MSPDLISFSCYRAFPETISTGIKMEGQVSLINDLSHFSPGRNRILLSLMYYLKGYILLPSLHSTILVYLSGSLAIDCVYTMDC